MPPKRATRSQSKAPSKAASKKKKDDVEDEEEEDNKKLTKKTQNKKATKTTKASKAAQKTAKKAALAKPDDDEDDKPRRGRSTRPTRGGSTKGKAAKGDDEDKKAKSKSATKGGKRKQSKSSADDDKISSKKVKKDDGKDDKRVKKVVTKGGAAIDDEFYESGFHVYVEKGTAFTKTLNQSNLNRNNNKFYIIQLLEHDSGKYYYTWNRWGRVGVRGQIAKKRYDDVEDAKKDFNKKLHDKTVRGEYVVVDISYSDDEEEEEEEDAKKDTRKKSAKKDTKASDAKKEDKKADKKESAKKTKAKKDDDDEEEEEKMVKVVSKGGVAVDQYFEDKNCTIYSSGGKVYAKTLNQSNLNRNNNKFYIIQLLEDPKKKGTYYVWNRWGRVGVKGQFVKKIFTNVQEAIADFDKKLREKTVAGDYVEVDINYDEEEEEEEKDEKDSKKKGKGKMEEESKLPSRVKDLIKLIFDLKMMNSQMKEIGYDPSRMPLGKLSKNAIQKGYEVLKQLAEAIKKKQGRSVLNDLSGQFYSQIPHDFGFKKMSEFVIDTDKLVKEKLEMLGSLEEIQIATKLLDESKGGNGDSIIDTHYKKLKCDIVPVGKDSKEFKLVQEYIKNTHASTHSSYKLEIEDLFTVVREGEEARYTKNLHNKMLLWHGSRLTNYVGILSQGLRIAPPEAPVTGYMFGKGVYFADMVSKSANYCFTNPSNNTGLMMLCEVALGNCNEKLQSDYYADRLPAGKHSTKGVGRTAPPESSYKTVDGDVAVPIGKGETKNIPGASLLYNEFIVYNINQIKIRYLIRLKFNYGR